MEKKKTFLKITLYRQKIKLYKSYQYTFKT